jgi:hypothetical protein
LSATSTASAAAASSATTKMRSPAHRRLRQALRRQRCTARPLLTRPAWPRRALRSHDHQRAPRKLSVPPTILPRRYTPEASVQLSHLTLSGCQLLSQGRPGVRLARHQRCRQALRRQHGMSGVGRHCDDSTASAASAGTATKTMHSRRARHQRCRQALRRQQGISGVGRHCDDDDAQPTSTASAVSASTATTARHQRRRQALRRRRCTAD